MFYEKVKVYFHETIQNAVVCLFVPIGGLLLKHSATMYLLHKICSFKHFHLVRSDVFH